MKKSIIIIYIVFSLVFFIACDAGLEIADVKIQQYPSKIAYIMGKDSELILDGLELLVTAKDGTQTITHWDDSHERSYIENQIDENVDFKKAGVYIIKIRQYKSSCNFAIEVLDPNNFNM